MIWNDEYILGLDCSYVTIQDLMPSWGFSFVDYYKRGKLCWKTAKGFKIPLQCLSIEHLTHLVLSMPSDEIYYVLKKELQNR